MLQCNISHQDSALYIYVIMEYVAKSMTYELGTGYAYYYMTIYQLVHDAPQHFYNMLQMEVTTYDYDTSRTARRYP